MYLGSNKNFSPNRLITILLWVKKLFDKGYICVYAAGAASGGTLNFIANSSNSASFFAIDITIG